MTEAATTVAGSMEFRVLNVDEVLIGDRMRRLDEVAVRRMMESIELVGQVNPIGVTPHNVLVHGLHRLEAHKRLGRQTIMASIVESADDDGDLAREIEFHENDVRVDMTLSERHAYYREVAAVESKRAADRLVQAAVVGADRRWNGNTAAVVPEAGESVGRVRDIVREKVGMSEKTFKRVDFIKNVAEDEELPEEVRVFAQQAMAKADATGKLEPQYQAVERAVAEVQQQAVVESEAAKQAALSKKFVDFTSRFEEGLDGYDVDALAHALDSLAFEGLGALARRINRFYQAIGEARASHE